MQLASCEAVQACILLQHPVPIHAATTLTAQHTYSSMTSHPSTKAYRLLTWPSGESAPKAVKPAGIGPLGPARYSGNKVVMACHGLRVGQRPLRVQQQAYYRRRQGAPRSLTITKQILADNPWLRFSRTEAIQRDRCSEAPLPAVLLAVLASWPLTGCGTGATPPAHLLAKQGRLQSAASGPPSAASPLTCLQTAPVDSGTHHVSPHVVAAPGWVLRQMLVACAGLDCCCGSNACGKGQLHHTHYCCDAAVRTSASW
jgi:hypothetical protein